MHPRQLSQFLRDFKKSGQELRPDCAVEGHVPPQHLVDGDYGPSDWRPGWSPSEAVTWNHSSALPGNRRYSLSVNAATQTHEASGTKDSPASFSLTYQTREGNEQTYHIHSDPSFDFFESRRLGKSGGFLSPPTYFRNIGKEEHQSGPVSREERTALMDLLRKHLDSKSLPLPVDSPSGDPEYLVQLRAAAKRQRPHFLQWLHSTPSHDRLLPEFIRELNATKTKISLGKGQDSGGWPDLFEDHEKDYSHPVGLKWKKEGILHSGLKYELALTSHSRRHLESNAEQALVDVHLHLQHPDGRMQRYRVSSEPDLDSIHLDHHDLPSSWESPKPKERSLILGLLSQHVEPKSLALPDTSHPKTPLDEFRKAAEVERRRAASWIAGQLRL